MSATLTVDLPEDVRVILGKAAREDGMSENAFASQALQDYLRLRGFKKGSTGSKENVDILRDTMDRMRGIAKQQGLTPDILDEILSEK